MFGLSPQLPKKPNTPPDILGEKILGDLSVHFLTEEDFYNISMHS